MKHLLKMLDLSSEEIIGILNLADQLKYEQKHGIAHKHLEGKSLGLIFENASTRTRVSFEVGMYQLGGQPIFLSARDMQIGRGEPVQDNKTYEVVETPKSVGDAPVGCTEADVELLASLINHESSFSDEGRLMVGSVVVNRMNNTGDNVYDTIASPGQFTAPWGLNYYTDADYEAAEYVLENGATNTDVYYFTGCHGDGLNWFTDYNGNWVGAY